MSTRIKYNDSFYIPIELADDLDRLKLSKSRKDSTCKFIKTLMQNSKRKSETKSIYNYCSMPYKYLVKIFGGRYLETLSPLLDSGIIERIETYSTKTKESKKYRINTKYQVKITEKFKGKELKKEEGSKEEKVSVGLLCLHENQKTQYNQLFTEVSFKDMNTVKTTKYSEYFTKIMSKLVINLSKLAKTSLDRIERISILDYDVNEQINEDVIPLLFGEEIKYLKINNAIELAKEKGLSLIKDGRTFVIEKEEDFIAKKKADTYISDSNCILELRNKHYRASRNSTNNRLDTNLSNMPSELLKVILEDNNLVELDFCNSQIAICAYTLNLDTEDFIKFKDRAYGCSFYEHMQEDLNLMTRDKAKNVTLVYMFSSEKNTQWYVNKIKGIYPTVHDNIKDIKTEKGYKEFSIMLQKKEADIFIDNLYQRLVDRGLLVFSKHDSLIHRAEDRQEVEEIVKNYFEEIDFKVSIR